GIARFGPQGLGFRRRILEESLGKRWPVVRQPAFFAHQGNAAGELRLDQAAAQLSSCMSTADDDYLLHGSLRDLAPPASARRPPVHSTPPSICQPAPAPGMPPLRLAG